MAGVMDLEVCQALHLIRVQTATAMVQVGVWTVVLEATVEPTLTRKLTVMTCTGTAMRTVTIGGRWIISLRSPK